MRSRGVIDGFLLDRAAASTILPYTVGSNFGIFLANLFPDLIKYLIAFQKHGIMKVQVER